MMNETLRDLSAWLGFPRLTFDLDERSRRRIMWVSVLPALIVSAVLTEISLGYALEQNVPPPDFWDRVGGVASAVEFGMLPVAVAILFAAGLRPWRRAEGSCLLLIALALAITALGLATVSSGMFAVFDPQKAQNLRAYTWLTTAQPFGLLAIGYFFLAFRALVIGGRRPAVRRPRRYPPPPEGASAT